MSHARQQIREAIVTLLDAITDVTGYVKPFRTAPHDRSPDIVVYTTTDEIMHQYDADNKYIHALTVEVEIRKKANDTLDDDLDALCSKVEVKMFTDPTLGGKVKQTELIQTDIKFDGEGNKDTGLATLTFEVWYRTVRTAPETIVA